MEKPQLGDGMLAIDENLHTAESTQMDDNKTVTVEEKQKWLLELFKKAKTTVTKLFSKELGSTMPIQKITQWYVNLVLGEELIDSGSWPENA